MTNQTFRLRLTVVIWFLIAINLNGQGDDTRVLFVGNSYTYFWNLPQNVESMAESTGNTISTYQSTAGGSHWGHHWRGERDLTTIDIIKNGNFDIIILQNHSMSAFNRSDSLQYYGQLMSELADESDSKVYLYETWSRTWDPFMQEVISNAYEDLASKIGAQVVPVGKAWQKARQLRPELSLYDSDGSHPNSTGTYLTACVFYAVLTGKSPVGLPNRLVSKDFKGEKLYLNIQSAGDALFCQKVAESMVENYLDKN
jgi:hypothetical protein